MSLLGSVVREATRPVAAAAGYGRRTPARLALDALDTLLDSAFLEVATDHVLASPWTERTLTKALTGPALLEQVDGVLADGVVERVTTRILAGPELDALVALAVDSPALERAVGRVFESKRLDDVVDRLLEPPELWRIIDQVVKSPAVTDAIAHQGRGFADQVAD